MAAPTPINTVLINGRQNYAAVITCLFTAAAHDPLSGYVAVDGSAAGDLGVDFGGNELFPLTNLKIIRMQYDASPNIGVRVLWDAGTDQEAWIFNGQGAGKQDFRRNGGLFIPSGLANATGKILLTTHGIAGTPVDGDFFSLFIHCRKDIHQ